MSKQGKFHGEFEGGKYKVNVQLQIYYWQEGNIYFVYSPAMDLTGYGNTQEEAKRSFEYTLGTTLSYMENKSTMFDELERLGWLVNRRKKRVQAPDMETLKADNDEFAALTNKPGVTVQDESLALELA